MAPLCCRCFCMGRQGQVGAALGCGVRGYRLPEAEAGPGWAKGRGKGPKCEHSGNMPGTDPSPRVCSEGITFQEPMPLQPIALMARPPTRRFARQLALLPLCMQDIY